MTLKMKCTTCAGHGDALLYRGPKVLEDTKTCPDCTDGEIDMPEPAMLLEICERLPELPELREPCVLCEGEGQWVDKDRGQYSVYYNCTQCGGTRAGQKHQRDNDPDQGRGWNPPSVDVEPKLRKALEAKGWTIEYHTKSGWLMYIVDYTDDTVASTFPAATVLALRTMEAE